jgi:minor extracellular serine protease Vpr
MRSKLKLRLAAGRRAAAEAAVNARPRFAGVLSAALFSALLATTAATLLAAPAAQAQSVAAAEAEGTNLWFVELQGAPEADGNSKAAVKAEQDAFRKAAAEAGVKMRERRSFDVLFNGFSVEVGPRDRAKLAQVPGFKAMYPVEIISAPDPERFAGGAAPDLATAIGMTGADIAQNVLGLTGAGIKVAVMDTGIDYDHPALGGSGVPGGTAFPSARVTHGYDFVGDAFDANPANPTYNPVPAPDPNPDDCNGHGTHVAGIVGANGSVKGVAPGVTFGAYRVFGCEGSTTADIMIAAMEMALRDRMDVLNMSIGSAFQWPQYPTAQAASRLVKKGMVVVASIGNSGTAGLYAASAPGLGKDVIGVASYDNTMVTLSTFTISPDNTAIGYAPAASAPLPPTSGTSPMARTHSLVPPALPTNDGCTALAPGSLAGKVALIRRGTCTFHQKALNAQNAGAIGVVLYNNSAGRFSPTVAGTPAITIPVVAISDTEGVLINNRLAAGSVDMTWTAMVGSFPNPTAGLISSFSSYGLSPDLSLKPNIGAPGGLIYSTYPIELGAFATISGTSMSSPHVAGGAALLLEARPKTKAGDMKGLLQNAADPRNWWGNPALGFLDNVHRQGAGMLDIPGAVVSTTTIEPSELALGESEVKKPKEHRLRIRNNGSATVTYDLTHVTALATGPNTHTPGFFLAPATVTFSQNSVTIGGGKHADVHVSIMAPDGLADRSLYGGYIVATPQGGGNVARVPFAGFKGDYQSIPALTPTANGFPWLAKLSGGFFLNQPTGATYTMAGDDIPYFLLHLDHQVELLRLEAADADTGKSFDRVSNDEFVGRNSSATAFFAIPWDGMVFRKDGSKPKDWRSVPNGNYVVTMKVLKALGDPKNPDHWETWTSPVITIARP